MKQYLTTFRLLAAFLLLQGLAACTLYMEEEPILPEEERGFSEAVHVKNDTIDWTYKFRPTTKVVGENALPYLIQVEADTILYFMENTPDEYMPVAGGCLYANRSEKLPEGLIVYVLSVERTNGMMRVVTTNAGLRDVFEQFHFKADMPLDPKTGYYDPKGDTLGLDTLPRLEPATYTLFDDADDARELGIVPNHWTRGDDEDGGTENLEKSDYMTLEYDTDSRQLKVSSTIFPEIFGKIPEIDVSYKEMANVKGIYGNIKDAYKTNGNTFWEVNKDKVFKPYFKVSATLNRVQKAHVEVDMWERFVEYWVDDDLEVTIRVEGGVIVDGEKLKEMAGQKLDKIFPNLGSRAKAFFRGKTWPIGATPFCFLLRPDLDITIEAQGCAYANVKYQSHTITGTTYNKGTVTDINRDITPKYSPLQKLGVEASIKAEVKLRGGIGVKFAGFADITLGVFYYIGAEAKYAATLYSAEDDNKREMNEDTYFRIYNGVGFDIGLRVAFDIYFEEFVPFDDTWTVTSREWDIAKWYLNPMVDDSRISVVLDPRSPRKTPVFNASIAFSDVGWLRKHLLSGEYTPVLRVYDGDELVEQFDCMNPTSYNDMGVPILSDDSNDEYQFILTGLKRDNLYKAIPTLLQDGIAYEYGDHAYYFSSKSPNIIVSDITQIFGGFVEFYNKKTHVTDAFTRYDFAAKVKVAGASKLDSWGINMKVYNSAGKLINEKNMDINKMHSRTFNLRYVLRGTSTFRPPVYVEITPYGRPIDSDGKPMAKENFSGLSWGLSFMGTLEDAMYDLETSYDKKFDDGYIEIDGVKYY